MELSGSNCVSDGINIVGMSLRVTGDNVKVRDFTVNGNGQSFKVGLIVTGNNVVLERGQVSRMLGNDKHCYTLGQGASNIWIIDSEGFYCSGDGFQAGHRASANPPTNVYLVRNTFYNNRENGIDLKYVNNVVAAQNIVYNARSAASDTQYCLPDMPDRCSIQNSGSDGTAIIIGSDGGPTGWAFYNNVVYDSDGCFRVEDSFSEGIIKGNQCDNISRSALQLDKRSVGRILFTDNTITNASRGIFQNWRDNFALDLVSNTFQSISGPAIEYETRAVCENSTLVGNIFSNTGSIICGNTFASTAAEINALPGASANVVQ